MKKLATSILSTLLAGVAMLLSSVAIEAASPAPIAVPDTAWGGDYMNYKLTSPIGKVISNLDATEISQSHDLKSRYRFDSLLLPARIARVAKGNYERGFKKVKSILANDEIGYFELSDFETPLKRKAFASNPDYQWFHDEFAVVKDLLKRQVFYVAMPIVSQYDLNEGTFTVTLPYYETNGPHRAFDYANQLAEGLYLHNETTGLYKSKITIPVDENTAVKVEGNGCSLVMMGKFYPELLNYRVGEVSEEDAIIFLPSDYYIVRDSDGEIITKIDNEPVVLQENPEDYDEEPTLSLDPDDYEFIYFGYVGPNKVQLCYLQDIAGIDEVDVLGFVKVLKSGNIYKLEGKEKTNGQLTFTCINDKNLIQGYLNLEPFRADQIRGYYTDKKTNDLSEVLLELVKSK